MNVLFLFVGLQNLSDDRQMFNSLIHEFKNHGHNVLVSSRGDNEHPTHINTEGGIKVLRIKSRQFTGVSNSLKKAFAYQEYVVKQRYYISKYFKNEKIDLIISHSLPPELSFVISGIKSKWGSLFYLIQTDFTWQDAVAYGMFHKNGPICLYYRFWERRLMKQADFIGCPTKGNQLFIKNEYKWISNNKFDILRFWKKEIYIESNIGIKKKFGIEDKFVAIYGGSVGKAQRIEHIIDLAESCQEYPDILFLILGRGSYLGVIKDMVIEKHLSNVKFIDYLPQNEYMQLLSSCDVGFVVLNEKHATPNFPSKTLSYFNLRVPILAAIDAVTDFGVFLDNNNVGLWSIAGDVDNFKNNLLKYYHSKELRERIKEEAYRLFKDKMQPNYAYDQIIKKVEGRI